MLEVIIGDVEFFEYGSDTSRKFRGYALAWEIYKDLQKVKRKLKRIKIVNDREELEEKLSEITGEFIGDSPYLKGNKIMVEPKDIPHAYSEVYVGHIRISRLPESQYLHQTESVHA